MHENGHPVVSHPDVFVNVRRTLVPLVAIRTLESWLFAAVVLHVGFQCFLVGVAGVTPRTVIRHLAGVPGGILFVLLRVVRIPIFHVRSQHVQDTGGVVRAGQGSSYEQENRADC